MPTITFDGPNKAIVIGHDGPITSLTAADLYASWKEWVVAGNAQYQPAFAESVGGNPLGGGVSLSGYFFLRNDLGWSITHSPFSYEIRVSGDLYPLDPLTVWINPTVDPYSVQFVFQRSAASYVLVGGGGGAAPADVADAVWDRSVDAHTSPTSMGGLLRALGILGRNKTVTDPVAGTMTVYAEDGTTALFTAPLWEDVAGTQAYRGQGADRRDRLV